MPDPTATSSRGGKVNQEDFVLADINLECTRQARASFHALSVRQPELYAPLGQPALNRAGAGMST